MRHGKSFNHLGRKTGHRKAMLSNMAASLILHKKITTTTAKAKALRSFVEPLITKSKEDSTSSRRTVFSYLQNKEAVSELFREISPKIADRPGGYTRILKTGTRLGDSADMCVIELVDYNETYTSVKEDAKGGKSRRRRKSSKKTEDAPVSTEAKATEATEAVETIGTVETAEETATVEVVEEEVKAEETPAADEGSDSSNEEAGESEEKKEE